MRSLKEFKHFLEGALHRSSRRVECTEELSSFLAHGISLKVMSDEVRASTERSLADICGLPARIADFPIGNQGGQRLFPRISVSWLSERAWSAALARAHEVEMETRFSQWLSVLLDREIEKRKATRELLNATEYLYFHESSELARITRYSFGELLAPHIPNDARTPIMELAFRSASMTIAYWLTYESIHDENEKDVAFLKRRDGLRELARAIMDFGVYPMYKTREGSNRFVFLSL